MNAVRAVRRLSSFGASLLGKSGSPLRDRNGQSIESPQLSIAEDCEGINGEKEKVTDLSREENIGPMPQINMSEDRKKPEQKPIVIEKVFVKRLSDSDSARSLANISQLRQKFESMSDISQPSKVLRNEPLTIEPRPRSNSLEWDYRSDKLINSNEKGDTNLQSSPNFKHYNETTPGYRDKSEFFKSKTIERSSRLVDKANKSLGKLSRSTESLLSDGRPNRISLHNGSSVSYSGGRTSEQKPRSPVETLRDRKKLLNEGVLPTERELNCSTDISNVNKSVENGSPESVEDQGSVWHKRALLSDRKSSENPNVDSTRVREASTAMMKNLDKKNLLGQERIEFDVDKANAPIPKARVPQRELKGNGKIETVRYKSVLDNRRSSKGDLLAARSIHGRVLAGKGKNEYLESNKSSDKPESFDDGNSLTRNYIGIDNSQANENAGGLFVDKGLHGDYRRTGSGCATEGQKEMEGNVCSNEPRYDDLSRIRDLSGNNYNGELATDIVAAVKTIGSTDSKDSKSCSTGSRRDITNKESTQNSVQDSAAESKQADFHSDYSMPHKRGWFKSSAAAKRG